MLVLMHGFRRKHRFTTCEHLEGSCIKTQPSTCSADMFLMRKVSGLGFCDVGSSGHGLLCTKVVSVDGQVDPLRSMGLFKYIKDVKYFAFCN